MKRVLVFIACTVLLIVFGVALSSLTVNTPQPIPSPDVVEPLLTQSIEEKPFVQDVPHVQQMTNPYFGTPCSSQPSVQFTHDVTEVGDIREVEPSIPTPGNSRHRAWLDIDIDRVEKVPVYAPVESDLVSGVYKSARGATDYDLHFQVSCEIWYLINHITEPVERIRDLFPATPQNDTRDGPPLRSIIHVQAGELLGYTTGTPLAHNFDFGVFDLNHVNDGLPAEGGSSFGKEKNFICPFDVFPASLKAAYYAKIIPSERSTTNCVN